MSPSQRSEIVSPIGRGPRGFQGRIPMYHWDGPKLSFENTDGTFGVPVNLLGPEGPSGDAQNFRSRAVAQASHVTTGMPYITTAGFLTPGDGGHAQYALLDEGPVSPDARHINTADGQWFTLVSQPVNPMMLGAKGDGVTADEAAINLAISLSVELGTHLRFPARNFIVAASKHVTPLGANRYYALDWLSNMTLLGVPGKTVIKIADNQSSDAAPKDVNIFLSSAQTATIHIQNIIFDCNGDNNKMSPSRGSGIYERFCSGAINITGNEASVDDLYIVECEFNNCPGTNQIVTGQSANGVLGPLGKNFYLLRCKFHNNGLDTDDHSCVYAWGENVWALDNVFVQDESLDKTGKNWGTFEIHGSNSWYCRNVIRNFFRIINIASNFSYVAKGLHMHENDAVCWFTGFTMFRAIPELTNIQDVFISHNRVTITAGASAGVRSAVVCAQYYNVGQLYVTDNRFVTEGTGYSSSGMELAALTDPASTDPSYHGAAVTGVYFLRNHVEGFQKGFNCRLNDGDGALDEIHEHDNVYTGIGETIAGADDSFGSVFWQAGSSSLGAVSSRNNRYVASGSAAFNYGLYTVGEISSACFEDNTFLGVVTTINDSATINRREGEQARRGVSAPSSGVHLSGERWLCTNPTKARNISEWITDGVDFRAFGIGFGTTGERPSGSLTTSDAGYSYFDTTLSKMILWDGGSWNV